MLMRRVARPLLAATFVVDGVDTFLRPEPRVKAADALVQRGRRSLPDTVAGKLNADPETLVRVNAGVQAVGGLLLAFGKAPRLASFALAVTVIPATLTEQDFWAEPDPALKAAKRNAFLKDVGLLGGLLIASGDTEGRPSLAWRGRRAARRAASAASAALPIGASTGVGEVVMDHVHDAAARARVLSAAAATKGAALADAAQARGVEIAATAKEQAAVAAGVARERGSELAEVAKERGGEWADVAKERGGEWADVAKERGSEWADVAKERGGEFAEVAKERGGEWAELAREQAAATADIAKERGGEWKDQAVAAADVTKERGGKLAGRARRRAAELAESAKEH